MSKYELCPRCGTMIDENIHECKGINMRQRTVEELEQLPLAVILDDELPILVNGCKNMLDMDLVKLVVTARGLESKFPELYV